MDVYHFIGLKDFKNAVVKREYVVHTFGLKTAAESALGRASIYSLYLRTHKLTNNNQSAYKAVAGVKGGDTWLRFTPILRAPALLLSLAIALYTRLWTVHSPSIAYVRPQWHVHHPTKQLASAL